MILLFRSILFFEQISSRTACLHLCHNYHKQSVYLRHYKATLGEHKPLVMEEQPDFFSYYSPRFKAEASLTFPRLRRGDAYSLGWVQAVTEKENYLNYSNGKISWELHDLKEGRSEAVCDSMSSHWPWYGVKGEERASVKGPASSQTVKVEMEDELSTAAPWGIPLGMPLYSLVEKARLERLFHLLQHFRPHTLVEAHRKQSLVTWLVLKNKETGTFTPLKGVSWSVLINISVDCSKPIGQRATLLEPLEQKQLVVLSNLAIPSSALTLPCANEVQKQVVSTGGKTYYLD